MKKRRTSRLKNMRVYLAGTMEYSEDEGVEWRKLITPRLQELGLIVLDPTDRPVRLSYAENSAGEQLHMLKRLRREGRFKKLVKCAKEIVHQDLGMVDRTDFLLVYIDPKIPTIGTIDEYVTASNGKKPIFLVCKEGLKEIPIWFWGRTGNSWKDSFCDSFDDMIERLTKIAYCSDDELDDLIDRRKWLFLNP